MTLPALTYSEDQAAAHDAVADLLREAGIDLDDGLLLPPRDGKAKIMAITGKAGSGKTLLLAELCKSLQSPGGEVV